MCCYASSLLYSGTVSIASGRIDNSFQSKDRHGNQSSRIDVFVHLIIMNEKSKLSIAIVNIKSFRKWLWLFSGLLFLCLLLLPSPALAHAQIGEVGSIAQNRQNGPSCLQPPTYKQALTLSDAELARYGFPSHFILTQNPTTWQRNLTNAHRVCQQAGTNSLNIHSALAGPAKTNFIIAHLLQIVVPVAILFIAIGIFIVYSCFLVPRRRICLKIRGQTYLTITGDPRIT
jgi:hypothetical protein